jgi:hypothetical protein
VHAAGLRGRRDEPVDAFTFRGLGISIQRRRCTPTVPRTTSAARSRGARSAPVHAAIRGRSAAIPSSASPRPAQSSAWHSGTISAPASGSRDTVAFHPCQDSSAAVDTPRDTGARPGFCPCYTSWLGSQLSAETHPLPHATTNLPATGKQGYWLLVAGSTGLRIVKLCSSQTWCGFFGKQPTNLRRLRGSWSMLG